MLWCHITFERFCIMATWGNWFDQIFRKKQDKRLKLVDNVSCPKQTTDENDEESDEECYEEEITATLGYN